MDLDDLRRRDIRITGPLEAEKAWMEMIHRYLAASLGLLAMLLVFFSWRARTQAPGLLRWTSLLLGLVIVQGAFGAWTVTLKLWPQVVTRPLPNSFTGGRHPSLTWLPVAMAFQPTM
ncbi:MAG TPA: hypothetical protein EYO94_06385 [Acidobacteria bacterium]|nr:hypothetical protein [Acidobacteriota bacterium]